jgi:hypothetical protein
MPARLALVRLVIIEELWWLFLVVFDRGIAFVSLSRVTERIL